MSRISILVYRKLTEIATKVKRKEVKELVFLGRRKQKAKEETH